MNKVFLHNIAYIVKDRINSNEIHLSQYVDTDSIISNKNGKNKSLSLPVNTSLFKFKKNDILVSNIRPYLKKIWLATFDGGCSTDILVFRSKNEALYHYLFALLLQDNFYSYSMLATKGVKMPRGIISHIINYPIKPININNKIKIGNFVLDIENFLQLNNKIKYILNKLEKDLYKYWFVQFDFPDENGRPYKSSGGKMVWSEELQREIPYGWKVGNIRHNPISSLISSGVDYFNEKNYLATKNINGEIISDGEFITYENRETRANMQPQLNSVWFAKMQNSIKHITLPNNSQWFIDKYILSTGFFGLKCQKDALSYIHCFINSKYFENKKDTLAHGATQKAVNASDIENILLLIPTLDILKQFNDKVYSLLEMKLEIIKQNQELTSLRDFLLPLLMNGQAVIKE